jgi:hypothetical protein
MAHSGAPASALRLSSEPSGEGSPAGHLREWGGAGWRLCADCTIP